MTKRYLLQRGALLLGQIGFVTALFLLWERGANSGSVDPVFFSRPSAIWKQIWEWRTLGSLWPNIRTTMEVFALGYTIGTVIGLTMGVLIGTVRLVKEILEPFLSFFNAMPRLILLPLLVVWFGFGYAPKVILVVLVISFVITINVSAGIREVRADLLNNAKLMGAGRFQLIKHVYGPSIALWVLSTARLTVGYAFNATVAGEFIGTNAGVGFLLALGQNSTNATQVWAALGIIAVLAVVLDTFLSLVETRATRWMPTFN